MALRVYNTLTKQKEEFIPKEEGKVGMYVCGVTPYNHPHIGNARPFVTWDVIKRYLTKKGYQVKHIQNFTDVDDKIIRTANAEGVTWKTICDRYIDSYFEVMDKLNVIRAEIYPRVSDHMQEIIDMVQTLQNKGFAYEVDGDVYYSVEKFDGYGKLSGRELTDMKAGARVDVDERKHHAMDFALWKSAKPGEPAWDSPWGKGRPGWHIECSAMSLKYLGCSFDFHGGGSDLIFPHHENEIAQSEACSGCEPFVRYWLHNGFITVNEEKMSKSLGNFFTVQDILEHYKGEVLRFFIVSTHYRSPLDFSDERLTEAARSLQRLEVAKKACDELAGVKGNADSKEAQALLASAKEAMANFDAAMEDDFNTALAISYLFALAKELNIYHAAVMKNSSLHNSELFQEAQGIYMDMANVIGILEQEEEAAEDDNLASDLMELIIEIRQQARQEKNWPVADRIRARLGELGIVLEDSPQGVKWKRQ